MINNKIILMLILLTVLVITACNNPEKAFKVEISSNESGEIIITQYLGKEKEVNIPHKIQNLTVIVIGNFAFFNKNITKVTIPDSVTEIGEYAFACNKLNKVTIPNSVTKIGDNAFIDNKLTELIIPDSATKIMARAFAWNKLTKITIHNSETEIGSYAFLGNNITSITIPNNVKLGLNAFARDFNDVYKQNNRADFNFFYEQNNRDGGTYRSDLTEWSKE